MVAARGWEEGRNGNLFNGYRVSVWDDEKVLEMDNDELYHMNVLTTELYTSKKPQDPLVSKTGNYPQIQGRHTVSLYVQYSRNLSYSLKSLPIHLNSIFNILSTITRYFVKYTEHYTDHHHTCIPSPDLPFASGYRWQIQTLALHLWLLPLPTATYSSFFSLQGCGKSGGSFMNLMSSS